VHPEVPAWRAQECNRAAGGADVMVCRQNLPLYLTLVADYRLNKEIAANAKAFLFGFTKLIDPSWLRMFNDRELQQLISGDSSGGFDLNDFQQHVQLGGGYHADHPVVRMLWRALATFAVPEQEAFLKFVTACSRCVSGSRVVLRCHCLGPLRVLLSATGLPFSPPLLGFKHDALQAPPPWI
jgi:HECT-domain (ubiquitin-transferase)